MTNILRYNEISSMIVRVRDCDVILDFNVARLYGVQTKEVNQAVKNNPRKFPEGYVLALDKQDVADLRSKNLTANSEKSRVLPKAFTEKGLYMLATILKGDKATDTAIDIIEAFAKLRELSRTIKEMTDNPDEYKQKTMLKKSGEIIDDLLGSEM